MPEGKNLDSALVTHIHNSANYRYYREVFDFILFADFDQDLNCYRFSILNIFFHQIPTSFTLIAKLKLKMKLKCKKLFS